MDAEFLHDLFSDFGAIDIKRMFSGRGLYAGAVMFAIVSRDGVLHFKTDEKTRAAYEREDCKPLTFTKKNGQRMVTSYWRLPERLYDDPGELAQWARDAVKVAQASRTKTRPKKTGTRPAVKTTKTKSRKKAKTRTKTKTKPRTRRVKR